MSPDMILSGDEGTGRTEVLLAVALYAAIARRQRVLYLVPDSHQAEMLARRLEKRCSDLFLEAFISCGILRAEQARKWIDSLKAKYSDESDVSGAPIGDAADIDKSHIFITHAGCDAEVVDACVAKLKATGCFPNIHVTRAGCTVSSHCGRNTLGVLFIRNHPI